METKHCAGALRVCRLTWLIIFVLIVAAFCTSGSSRGQIKETGIKSGPQAGSTIPALFHPLAVLHADSPEHAGKRWDFVEPYGAQPFILIFARTTSEPLADLLAKLDAAMAKQRDVKGKKDAAERARTLPVQGVLVLLSDQDGVEEQLRKLAKRLNIKHLSIAIDNPTGPRAYRLEKAADVTVLLVNRRKVEANYAFRKGELREMNVSQIVSDLQRILNLAGEPSATIEPSKIDRTIGKEPAYKSKPQYCLVVFGPEAKTRVWLVLDGDILYVDRNGNGDLTDKDERIVKNDGMDGRNSYFNAGVITVKEDGGTFHLGIWINPDKEGRQSIAEIRVTPQGEKGLRQWTHGRIDLNPTAKNAAVVHFGSPLTLNIMDWRGDLSLRKLARDEVRSFSILLGTPVHGNKSEAFAAVRADLLKLAGEVFPTIDVEFPGKEARDPPVRTKGKATY